MEKNIITKSATEWMKQAQYDFETAQAMFDSGRYIYAVFMSHLAVEKAIKGLFVQSRNEVPPKSHDLIYLSNKIELKLPNEYQIFVDNLNDLSERRDTLMNWTNCCGNMTSKESASY